MAGVFRRAFDYAVHARAPLFAPSKGVSGTTFVESPADTLGLSEAIANQVAKALAETLGLAEADSAQNSRTIVARIIA